MKPIKFSSYCQYAVIDDDAVSDLPVLTGMYGDGTPEMVSCWKLSLWERIRLLFRGEIFVHMLGTVYPPVKLSIDYKHVEQMEEYWDATLADVEINEAIL